MKCREKMPFPDRESAEIKGASIRRFGRNRYIAYKCPDCTAWHLATKRRK